MIVVLFSDEGAGKSVGGKAAGKIMSDSKMQAEGKLASWIAQLVKLKTRSAGSRTRWKSSSIGEQERPVSGAGLRLGRTLFPG